jgi:hypothetical protein
LIIQVYLFSFYWFYLRGIKQKICIKKVFIFIFSCFSFFHFFYFSRILDPPSTHLDILICPSRYWNSDLYWFKSSKSPLKAVLAGQSHNILTCLMNCNHF